MLVSGLRGSSLGYLPHHHFSPVTVAGAAAVSYGERMERKYVGLSPHHHPPPVTVADAGEWKGWVVSPTHTPPPLLQLLLNGVRRSRLGVVSG